MPGTGRAGGAGVTRLLAAFRARDGAALGALASEGLTLDLRDDAGRTCLHLAAGADEDDVVGWILEAGGDPAIPRRGGSEAGATPLHEAARSGAVATCRRLLRAGAPVEPVDAKGRTPLHRAATSAVAELLLDAGADPDRPARDGRPPRETAATPLGPPRRRWWIEAGEPSDLLALGPAGFIVVHAAPADLPLPARGWTVDEQPEGTWLRAVPFGGAPADDPRSLSARRRRRILTVDDRGTLLWEPGREPRAADRETVLGDGLRDRAPDSLRDAVDGEASVRRWIVAAPRRDADARGRPPGRLV